MTRLVAAPTQRVRDLLAARLSSGVVQHRNPTWPFGELTDAQLLERARQEVAMRSDRVRGVPSVFGALS